MQPFLLYYMEENDIYKGQKIMYYEEYQPRRRRPRRRRGGCLNAIGRQLVKLLAAALAVAVLLAGVLYLLPTALFMVEPDADLSLTDGLPSKPFNVLLLGVDAISSGSQRSDTMIIASIDGGSLKLTSIQRDMVANIPGHGKTKINAAYAYGGPELAMRTVNEALDMNIMRYVVVDFTVLVKMVDALGGIDMDITEAEMEHINRNVWLSRKVFVPQGYKATQLTKYGEDVHLNGLRALAYARIRKLDSDFVRTSRQRAVIEAMLDKLKSRLWNPVTVIRFLSAALSGVETNLSTIELLSLGEKALFSGGMEQLRLPLDGTFKDNGSTISITNRSKNIEALRQFIYGEE